MLEEERKTLKAEIMAELEEKIYKTLPFLQKNEVANYSDKTEEMLQVIVEKLQLFERRLRLFEEQPRTLNIMGYINRMEDALFKKEWARKSIEILNNHVSEIYGEINRVKSKMELD